eukprot:TRINITY_DN2503_c0_g1_i1.p1 TRINITY_DN2503_c0_g1~~TRINITY_DN2503_c0_g1_i1.p1  ORF type:complete len:166 (-),score=48.64 TRINITY_DN2503_c0_g1_i1:60-557(-)
MSSTTYYSDEKVDFTFPRAKIDHSAEEQERSERMRSGVDPVLLGKHHRIQEEFKYKGYTFPHALHWNMPHLPSASKVIDTASSWTHVASEQVGGVTRSLFGKAQDLVEAAKERLGFQGDVGSISSINKAEEAERLRRANEKVDPKMQARKHRVEDELLQTVRPAM